tara:strand:+ start:163 stop:1689 length:1527 start_codon:yes stop_codon:yes gene_type:complete
MDRFIKIQSNQSEFSSTANLCDFHIPAGDVYELRDSFVNFVFQIDVEETETASGVGVYNMGLEWITTDPEKPKFFNTALVKDCRMSAANKGIIDNVRRIDILSQVKQTYDKSWGEAKSESYLSADQVPDPMNAQKYSIYRQFNKTGINKSINNNNVGVQVRLGDLMEVCEAPEYDTMKTGSTDIHFRLNLDKVQPVLNMPNDNVAPAEVKTFKKIPQNTPVVNQITLGKADGSADLEVRDLRQVPYYTGMKVLLSATDSTGAATLTDAPVVIKEILYDKNDFVENSSGTYSLVFEKAWGTARGAGEEYTAISLKLPVALGSAGTTIASQSSKLVLAELVLKKIMNPQGLDSLNYHTFDTIQSSGNAQTSFHDVQIINGESDNMLLTFQDGADNLISKNNQLESYQISVDNVPQTDRLVDKNSPLDYDRKYNTFQRLSGGLRNLTENAGNTQDYTWATTYADAKFNSTIVAAPLPSSQNPKQLQLNINASAGGIGQYALFTSLPRTLVF